MKNPIFILGLFDTGYYTARLLKDDSIIIFGFDFDSSNPGFYSRLIKSYIVPNPCEDPDILLKILIDKRNEFTLNPVLIPTSELFLFFIQTFRKKLESLFLFLIPQETILGRILNKAEQYKMAQRVSIKVPNYLIVNDANGLNNSLSSLKFPVVVKGLDQVTWKFGVNRKAYIAESKERLAEIIQMLLRKGVAVIVQEMIQGGTIFNYEYNALMVNGNIIEHNVIQKLHQYPLFYGAACCAKSIANKDIEELGSKFIIENNIEGFSNTEFKLDPTTGIFNFIETNSRVWLQIEMTKKSGQNYLKSYYNFLTGNKGKINNSKRIDSSIWVDLPSYLVLIFRHRKEESISILKAIQMLSRCSNYGLLSFSDPCPFTRTVLFKKQR